MVECDWGKNADVCGDRGGGIESPAHAGFEDNEFAILVTEVTHGESESEFEEGGVVFPILNEFFEGDEVIGRGFGRDVLSVDTDSFVIFDEVR